MKRIERIEQDVSTSVVQGGTVAPILLRAPEVARLMGISVSKVYAMLRDGALPSVRVDGAVRVPRADLEAWLHERTQRSKVEG